MKKTCWLVLMAVAVSWGWGMKGMAAQGGEPARWPGLIAQNTAETTPQTPAATDEPATPPALPTADAAQPDAGQQPAAPPRKLAVTLVSFKKQVQVRENDEAPWVRPTAGMVLTEGAAVRTGLGSQAVLHIEPKQTVVVDRATIFKIVVANFDTESNRVKTNLGMEYGRINYAVQAAGVEHDASVSTPGNTLSIRGTVTFVQNDGLFPPITASYIGRVVSKQSNGKEIAYGDENGGEEGGEGDGEGGTDDDAAASLGLPGVDIPLLLQNGINGPAENNLPRTHNFSSNYGQTDSELVLDTDNPGGGFSPDAPSINGRRALRGAINRNLTADNFLDLVSNQPFLLFAFTWMNNADLDSFVTDPLGQTVAPFGDTIPGSVQQTPEGGLAGPDHLGPDGTELIRWQGNNIPQGEYTYGLKYFSGQDNAPFKVDVIHRNSSGDTQVIDTFTGVLTPENPDVDRTINVPSNSPQN